MNQTKMEQEYKWQIPRETLAALAAELHDAPQRTAHETINMEAIYYETPDNLVYKNGAAVRIRRENDRSICCMKRTVKKEGAAALREEYEVDAADLAEGLHKLPDAGAPRGLCALLSGQTFRELGHTRFIRNCYTLHFDADAPFTAEFAVDVGELGGNGHWAAFEELELELKSGSSDAFAAYAADLERRFALIPQPKSKLARAIACAGT